jgi:hypothetical protein
MQAEPGIESSPAAGAARSLLALRHALADPLSAASLKLDLVERRLAAEKLDIPALAERVRGVKADLSAAGHILDLLLRLAEILAEPPRNASLAELCPLAGVQLKEDAATARGLGLRRKGTVEAVRNVASFLTSRTRGAVPPLARADSKDGSVSLTLQSQGILESTGEDLLPARLLSLPPWLEGAEGLFLARAVLEADGGRLDMGLRDERLVAEFSWSVPTGGT